MPGQWHIALRDECALFETGAGRDAEELGRQPCREHLISVAHRRRQHAWHLLPDSGAAQFGLAPREWSQDTDGARRLDGVVDCFGGIRLGEIDRGCRC